MGKRGTAPTPTAILKLRGSWRGDINKDEPHPEPGRPVIPDTLNSEQKSVWRKTVNLLANTPGLLAKIDGVQLARYCVMLPLWWKLQGVIARFSEGNLLAASMMNKQSRAIIKDSMKWARELHAEMKRVESSYGMTPSDRSRLSVSVTPKVIDPLEDFLNETGG